MDQQQMAELQKWRDGVDLFIADSGIHRRANAIRMDAMEKSLDENTAMTTEIHSGLSEAIPVILDLRGAARTLKRIGAFVKPVAMAVSVIAAVWVWVKTGKWEITL